MDYKTAIQTIVLAGTFCFTGCEKIPEPIPNTMIEKPTVIRNKIGFGESQHSKCYTDLRKITSSTEYCDESRNGHGLDAVEYSFLRSGQFEKIIYVKIEDQIPDNLDIYHLGPGESGVLVKRKSKFYDELEKDFQEIVREYDK